MALIKEQCFPLTETNPPHLSHALIKHATHTSLSSHLPWTQSTRCVFLLLFLQTNTISRVWRAFLRYKSCTRSAQTLIRPIKAGQKSDKPNTLKFCESSLANWAARKLAGREESAKRSSFMSPAGWPERYSTSLLGPVRISPQKPKRQT